MSISSLFVSLNAHNFVSVKNVAVIVNHPVANKCYYTTVLWQMISSVETKSVTLFAPFCYFVYTIYISLLLLNSRTLSECMCLVFWTTTLSKCTFEIGQVNIYNFYLNMSDVLLPYPLILFKFSLSDIIFIWFVVFSG